MPFESQFTHYLEDFLDANEAMDVFGDRNDLDLRPPPEDDTTRSQPEPESRDTVQMSAQQFSNMFS